MPPKAKTICAMILAVMAMAWIGDVRADSAHRASINASAKAFLEKGSQGLFLHVVSHSFQPAQFAVKGQTKTVLVEGEIFQRLRVSDDMGAEGDQTGKVRLTIRPIDLGGRFGAVSATRELPGDALSVESPAGINVTTYGCCQESSAETFLSLNSLKTLYVRSGGLPLTTYTWLGKPVLGRLIAIYLAMTPEDESVLGNDPSAIAMITLVGEDEVMQRMRVHLRAKEAREAALGWYTEIGWRNDSGKLDNHAVIDPAKPSKHVFTWKIAEREAIELPLVNDRLDAAAATLPSGVTLEALSP